MAAARKVVKKKSEDFVYLDDDFDTILAFLEEEEKIEKSVDEAVENVSGFFYYFITVIRMKKVASYNNFENNFFISM
jgi:hypothetical protein